MTPPSDPGSGVGPQFPAPGEMTVGEMIDATPLGPILDTPVSDVLAGLGLPPLPVIPPLPPLPGLPPMPAIDLTMLVKPMTDLLGGFGTGSLAGAQFDPSAIFDGLSKVLDTSMSMGQAALKLADQLWVGQASAGAAAKTAEAGANSAALSTQGGRMSFDIQAAAGIVAAGLATLQGIIAATVAKIAAAVPMLLSPAAPAGASLIGVFASEGLAEATAAVAVTRAQLLGPTTTMTANGAPVPITPAPVGPKGPSPFAIASSVLDVVAPAVGMAAELPSMLTGPVNQMLQTVGDSPSGTTPAVIRPGGADDGDDGDRPGSGPGGAGSLPGTGGGGGGVGAMPVPLSALRPTVPATVPAGEPLTVGGQLSPRAPLSPAAMPMGGAPIGAMGAARGAAAAEDQHTVPDYLVNEGNGYRVVGETPEVAPAVIGDDEPVDVASAAPDIELRLGPPGESRT